jgi:hypothetical protein
MRFSVTTSGTVTGMRFYGPAVTSKRTGSLWSSTGRRLATATFAPSSIPGWQSATFATPVQISADTTYVVSYLSPGAGYAFDSGAFKSGVARGDIVTSAGAGVFKYASGGGFPTQRYQNGSYYVDVAFTPGGATSSTTPGTASATPSPTPSSAPSAAPSTAGASSQPITPSTPPTTTTATTTATDDFGTSAGVPAGTTLTPSGSLTVSTPGTVINGLDINGTLTINANNVTVKNTRVTGSSYNIVRVADNATGVTLDHVTINGKGLNGTEGSNGTYGPGTYNAVDVSGVENGFVPSTGATITNSYVHDLDAPGSPHFDGIQIDGDRSNITVKNSTVDLTDKTQTSAVMVDNGFGPATNIVITGNRLLGAGYTVYADGQFNNNAITVTYANNHIAKGEWGYDLLRNAQVTWTGNTDDKTGQPAN